MDLPELAPSEQALLHRFRADESPSDAVVRRIEARLGARLELDDPIAPLALVSPLREIGRAAVLAVALAAAVLLVLGGSARLVQAVRTSSTPAQASHAVPAATSHEVVPTGAREPASASARPEAAPVIVPPPPAPEIELAAVPGAVDTTRHASPARPAAPAGPPAATASPSPDAAMEIALLVAAKREPEAERRLAKLREHATKFPNTELGQEFAVLEIETLCQLGRHERAAEASATFLRRYPDSAYAAIARRGCSREDGPR